MFEQRDDASTLFQDLGRINQTLAEASASGGVASALLKAARGTPSVLLEGQIAAPPPSSLLYHELVHLLNANASPSGQRSVTVSTGESMGRHFVFASDMNTGLGLAEAIYQETQPFLDQLKRGDPAPAPYTNAVASTPYAGLPSPFPPPYYVSSDATALASILSALERRRPDVLGIDSMLHDAAAAPTLPSGMRSDAPGAACIRNIDGKEEVSVEKKKESSTKMGGAFRRLSDERCPAIKVQLDPKGNDAEGEDEAGDDDSVAGKTHQRQHLLTTSLGPGAYFRARKRRMYRHESFPEKLHRMLSEASVRGMDDVVGFTPSGLAFAIHNTDAFLRTVIPDFFRHKSISSFRRQLSMYGFKRVKDNGPDHGAYQHELFRQDKPQLCRQMKRVSELELILPDDPTSSFRN